MFHERTISSLYEKYMSEQIDCGDVAELEELPTPAPMVAVLDKQVRFSYLTGHSFLLLFRYKIRVDGQ